MSSTQLVKCDKWLWLSFVIVYVIMLVLIFFVWIHYSTGNDRWMYTVMMILASGVVAIPLGAYGVSSMLDPTNCVKSS